MYKELPISPNFTSAVEGKDTPEQLHNLSEVQGEFLSRGVFFDVYSMELPDESGEPQPFVFKDFRVGDATMKPAEQVALFQHQYYEAEQLKTIVGEQFFPEDFWIRSGEFSDDEAHAFYAEPGKTANTMRKFMEVQMDRQLTDRYSSDDKKKGAVKKVMSQVGERIIDKHDKQPFIGAVVQERINGGSFEDILKSIDKSDPNYEKLRENVRGLIQGLRRYHDDNEYAAFTWHGLGSDNVMVEVDEADKITGRVMIIDANFTERPNTAFRDSVLKKIEQNVFDPLEKHFSLS